MRRNWPWHFTGLSLRLTALYTVQGKSLTNICSEKRQHGINTRKNEIDEKYYL